MRGHRKGPRLQRAPRTGLQSSGDERKDGRSWLSPHRCSAGGSGKEGPAGGVTLPTALQAQQSVLGSPENAHSPGRLGPSTSHTSHRQWLQVPRPAQGAHRSQLVSEDPCATTPKGAAASTHPSTKRHCTPDRVTPPPHCPEVLLCPTFLLCPLVCRVPCPGGPAGGAAFAC